MNTLQLTADRWLSDGIAVIPVNYRDKRPALPAWREFQQRLPTTQEVGRWFQTRLRNMAIITGWRGLTVLDFDQRPMYQLWREWTRLEAPAARFSYTVQTARGVHVYLFLDERVQTMRVGSIDVKAGGGYVLVPPSIHPSGRAYRVLSDAPIVRVPRLADVLPTGLIPAPADSAPRVARVASLSGDAWDAALNPALSGEVDLAALRARYNLLDLFPGAIRRGGRWWACCPLHADKHPSVTIDGDRAKCWAGCLAGDYLDWYGALHGLNLRQTLEALA